MKRVLGCASALVFLLGIGFDAQAAAPLRQFPYSKQTNLVPGAYKFVFSLYSSPTAPAPLWSSETVSLTLKTPVLVYALGSGTVKIPATIDFSQQLYVKVVKTYPAPSAVIVNRERYSIVPYAFWSASGGSGGTITAVNAGTGLSGGGTSGDVKLDIDTTAIQRRVDGECGSGNAIRLVGADGSVTCETVGDITAVTAGTGLLGGGEGGPVEIRVDIGTGVSQVAAGDHAHGGAYYSKAYVDALEARIAALEELQDKVAALESKLAHFSRNGNDISITGANLWVKSGSGSTHGDVNGLGNLIVGYNELRGAPGSGDDVRTGSHNIIVGENLNYSSYGGLAVGYWNTISSLYSSVSGGQFNTASGPASSVSGGISNTASGVSSSVIGGASNVASGNAASVSAGQYNVAGGDYSSVSGGGGGEEVEGNRAFANLSSILGGRANKAGDPALADHAIGTQSTVSGGTGNTASRQYSSVSGGSSNSASGVSSSVSGGYGNTASGIYSSVSGGAMNTASSIDSSVSGGGGNTASGAWASVSGGRINLAGFDYSSVSGGNTNTASGYCSSVSGGYNNTASGGSSSVSGGNGRSVSGGFDWAAGALFQEE